MLKCVQRSRDSRLDFVGGSRLQAARLKHTCQACQKLKYHTSCSLQDKSPRLARPFARGLNSRLNPVARLSRQNTLFGKTWRFTFLLTLLYIPLYPRFRGSFQREFWERNPRENKIDSSTIFTQETLQIPLLSSSPLSNPWETFYQNLFSPYPFLWEGCLVL